MSSAVSVDTLLDYQRSTVLTHVAKTGLEGWPFTQETGGTATSKGPASLDRLAYHSTEKTETYEQVHTVESNRQSGGLPVVYRTC